MKKIEEIIWYNQFEKEARVRLKEELDTILDYISNRTIALSYSDGGREDINRTIFKHILGHNVAYKIITNTDIVTICAENIEFDAEEYGLQVPPMLEETCQHNKSAKKIYRLNESQLRRIVMEVIQEFLSA